MYVPRSAGGMPPTCVACSPKHPLEERLTEVERRRVQRTITRGQAAARLELALREGPDREVVEALAELEASGAPFSDGLDWSRRGLTGSRWRTHSGPPWPRSRQTPSEWRGPPAARAALGDLQRAGPEWAELEQAVLRAAHLERLREALASGDDARIAAAADPDPFQVLGLLARMKLPQSRSCCGAPARRCAATS